MSSTVYKNINYDTVSNKPRKVQKRLKTDSLHDNPSKYQIGNQTSYGRIREERLKMFLNETLSIIKVNNHEMILKDQNDGGDSRKQSLRSKFSEVKLPS